MYETDLLREQIVELFAEEQARLRDRSRRIWAARESANVEQRRDRMRFDRSWVLRERRRREKLERERLYWQWTPEPLPRVACPECGAEYGSAQGVQSHRRRAHGKGKAA